MWRHFISCLGVKGVSLQADMLVSSLIFWSLFVFQKIQDELFGLCRRRRADAKEKFPRKGAFTFQFRDGRFVSESI